jgi:hypothetical protein
MEHKTRMNAQEFSMLYMGKNKHIKTIALNILWQAKEENSSILEFANLHSRFTSLKGKKSIM